LNEKTEGEESKEKKQDSCEMMEIPLSTVAWISVVLVQAIVHYMVFGARRARIQQEEDMVLEESLSLATTEGSMDTFDEPASFSDAWTIKDCGYSGTVISATPGTPTLLGEKLLDGDEPQDFLNLLTQTGTELLNVSSSRVIPSVHQRR
jgi:hypothetical protein